MQARRTCQYLSKTLPRTPFPLSPSNFPAICNRRYVSALNPLPVDTEAADDNTTTRSKVWDSIWTTTATLTCLGIAGYGYHKYYKWLTLKKIEKAFQPGDPALDLIPRVLSKGGGERADDNEHWVTRKEQEFIESIVKGEETGHYYLLIGEKGTGKKTMLLDAMGKINGEGCSMMDAHRDAEIFRVRLGKAIDFEYSEDFVGGLFSIRGPRDTTPLLDIERGLLKLEKVAIRHRARRTKKKLPRRPLVFMINSLHLLQDDEAGGALLEMLQQKAETWAEAGIITVILNSDDYWVYERLKQHASRMELVPVCDIPRAEAVSALFHHRLARYGVKDPPEILNKVYDLIGGRLGFLSRVANKEHMLAAAEEILREEKQWLLNQCGLIPDFDDDVMDEQKWHKIPEYMANYRAGGAFLLVQALVKQEEDDVKREIAEDIPLQSHDIPSIPQHLCRRIMTRADLLERLDQCNVIAIDTKSNVRASSVPMMRAFRETCSEEGFDEMLENVLERISEVESLGRTREVEFKDLKGENGKIRLKIDVKKGDSRWF